MNRLDSSLTQSVQEAIQVAKTAQGAWADQLPRARLQPIAKVAAELANHQGELLALNPRPNSSPADMLSSELLPLADACRFTAQVAKRALAPTAHSFRYGAWWMGRIGVRVLRQPWGTVFIVAPSNYPLFLPGVQIIQALAAGNAVVVKPAPGCEAILERFGRCLIAAGIPQELVQIIDASIEAGQAALAAGVDKVVLTGSVNTGRAVLSQLAQSLTPATMELSGCDAVFVTEKADLDRLARCLAYAVQLNGGATCIAPRRVFVTPAQASTLCELLCRELQQSPNKLFHVPGSVQAKIATAIREALQAGAKIVYGGALESQAQGPPGELSSPIVLSDVNPRMAIAQDDFFGPVVSLISVPNMTAALEADRLCPYGLGAAVFGPTGLAEYWAEKVHAGCVVINDIVVPTADPRVAFGGRNQSGWGVTRGWEGLVEMSRPHVICTRHGKWLPHLDQRQAKNARLLGALLNLFHGGRLRIRLAAAAEVVSCVLKPPSSDAMNQPKP